MRKVDKYRIFLFATLCLIFALFLIWFMTKGVKGPLKNSQVTKESERKEVHVQKEVEVGKQALFLLTVQNGKVVIRNASSYKIYDETGIFLKDLPPDIQTKIKDEIEIYNYDELYDFLENYSS